jgi:hypothetical protein
VGLTFGIDGCREEFEFEQFVPEDCVAGSDGGASQSETAAIEAAAYGCTITPNWIERRYESNEKIKVLYIPAGVAVLQGDTGRYYWDQSETHNDAPRG